MQNLTQNSTKNKTSSPKVEAFCQVSKPYIKTLIEQSKAKTRLDQKRLRFAMLVYQWSSGGKRRLGEYWHTGRNKGKTCFNKAFRRFLSRKMGLKQRQVHRYLADLLASHFIIKSDQHTFTGEFEYWLNPACGFLPKKGEKWFKFYIPKKSDKKNIFIELEKGLKNDTHGKEWDPGQMLFGLSRSTRRRAETPLKRPGSVSKVTPLKKIAPIPYQDKELKTTEGNKKNSKPGRIWLWMPDRSAVWKWHDVAWQSVKLFKWPESWSKTGQSGIFYKGRRFVPVYPGRDGFYKLLPEKAGKGVTFDTKSGRKRKKRKIASSPSAYTQYQKGCDATAGTIYKGAHERTQALLAEMKAHRESLGMTK